MGLERFNQLLVPRSAWGARKPTAVDTQFAKGGGVVAHHTVRDSSKFSHWPDCYVSVRRHQNYHMDTKGWRDLAYNFVICKCGFIFEGRGWEAQNGANTPVNDETLSVAFDVNGMKQVLDPAAIASFNAIAEVAVSKGWAPLVRGHDEANGMERQTDCPSPHIENLIVQGVLAVNPAKPAEPTEPSPVEGGTLPPLDAVLLVSKIPSVSVRQMQDWARSKGATAEFVRLGQIFYRESVDLGIDPAPPYALSYHETGGGKLGGVVKRWMNNWGGLKVASGGGDYDPNAHATFENDQLGVRAVCQHVACYAGVDLIPDVIVDPRWSLAVLGDAPYLPHEGWKWSSSPYAHGVRVAELVREMRRA